MQVELQTNLEAIPAAAWNALAGQANPFVQHAFLCALERNGCVGGPWGWEPQHLVVRRAGQLVGALPMYLKDNSYGEFVFDWAWADAYRQTGQSYYPKLVVAVPYTPATGPRLLAHDDTVRTALIDAALAHARALAVSSLHILFTDEAETARLARHGLLPRIGCQFHWHNDGYRDFDDYLARFNARQRKKIRRERRYVQDADVVVELLHGDETEPAHWKVFHDFYSSTFERKSGYATLSLGFFQEIAQTMPRQTILVLARHQGRYVAGAFYMRGTDTLYGRHWGCSEQFNSLHFELCYYRAIEYCIEQGLSRFEAGAQGEHKVRRGFEPTRTYSVHWLAHPGFRHAVADFLERETRAVDDYIATLRSDLPYRAAEPPVESGPE